jgi:hypothetical protein
MNIFDRLPAGLFGPLTGRNCRRAWDLIYRLATNYFGPDSIPPYPDGYLHEQITKEVERFLLDQHWESEDGRQDATPLNIQANMLVRRLVESGWLVEDRVGAKIFVSMRPIVSRFFETVQQFADEGPQLIGGNVQLVHNQLRSVVENPRQQVQGFISAATLCVRLINALNATTLRARDLMRELTLEHDTPVFVRRFFSEHISELYVRDFKDLRTENHPLRLRWDIIELVKQVTTEEPSRTELLAGYAELAKAGESPERMLERDISRFERLIDVEVFLDRMDKVMDQAAQRAIAYLGYRLKASDRIEAVIEDTIRSLVRAETLGIEVTGRLMPPPLVVSDVRLRMPVLPVPKPERKPMRKREMTVRERALQMLRREMMAHRDGSPRAMERYVKALLPHGGSVGAEDLPSETVEDAVAYLALLRLGTIAKKTPKSFASNPLLRRLGFEVELDAEGRRAESDLYETSAFAVRRREDNAT